jgi:tetratricopeptide repeat protein 21B
MSKEFKPQAYNYIRRGWYEQLNALCDSVMAKKGKDPLTAFWKAFALGMTGNITDCLRGLESFQSRKDLQFPVTLALMYFHKKASPVDREAVAQLKSELSIAEDVAVNLAYILFPTHMFSHHSIWWKSYFVL